MNTPSFIAVPASRVFTASRVNNRLFISAAVPNRFRLPEMRMLQAIDNIRAVAQLCQSQEPLPEPLAEWLASSLQAFLDSRTPSLNHAFGIRSARGGIPWRIEAGIRARDCALRALASLHLPTLSISAQAERIHQLSLRYAASGWRFDRDRPEMPQAYSGTLQEFLWRAFKSGATMPLCKRQLRTILTS